MGRHKLLLPWPLAGATLPPSSELAASNLLPSNLLPSNLRASARQPASEPKQPRCVIEHVLRAWVTSRVQHVLIVLRRDDQRLREACREWPVSLVCPEHDPLDMKASLQAGMDYLRQHFEPADTDGVCIAPADLPSLSSELIDQLLAATAFPAVSIPYFAGQSGHPVVLPWSLADELDQLADNEGLDVLLARQPQTRLQLPGHLAPRDIDTPQEYRAALRALGADLPPDGQR